MSPRMSQLNHYHSPRYEAMSCGSPPIDDPPVIYQPTSQQDSPDPQLSISDTSSFDVDMISEIATLATCRLEDPGCYVLVPMGLSPDEANKTSEDPKYLRDKKTIPTRKGTRKPMEEAERQAIKLNRKMGVCLRCKLFKEKVIYFF